jgi:hypothetical protein
MKLGNLKLFQNLKMNNHIQIKVKQKMELLISRPSKTLISKKAKEEKVVNLTMETKLLSTLTDSLKLHILCITSKCTESIRTTTFQDNNKTEVIKVPLDLQIIQVINRFNTLILQKINKNILQQSLRKKMKQGKLIRSRDNNL